ncbi:recombinase XerD, partial [Escherichia coli]|nr:recombinase XerD [Escherichia coli]
MGQFAQRIPTGLKPRLVGRTLHVPVGGEIIPITITDKMDAIRFSLRTDNSEEIKERQGQAIAYLSDVYKRLRASALVTLSHEQCVALSGELYRGWADGNRSRSITYEISHDGSQRRAWVAEKEDLNAEADAWALEAGRLEVIDGAQLEEKLGPLLDRLLSRKGIVEVTPETRRMLAIEFARALADGFKVRAGMAGGDYRPDPNSERFPVWKAPADVSEKRPEDKPKVTLTSLFDGWWSETERAGGSVSSKESFGKAMGALRQFLGHDDAVRITEDDMFHFKDHMMSMVHPRTKRSLSLKTVGGSYLGGINAVFNWAVKNNKLRSNPAVRVRVTKPKPKAGREKVFQSEEVRKILKQANSAAKRPNEPWQRFAGRRWVPWLCAYSGARVGEMVQLRKQDIRDEAGQWVMRITPDAVTVKTGQYRDVPLHPHLVDMGFVAFVSSAAGDHLFMWSGDGRAAWRTAKNRLTSHVREAIPDSHVAPNHAWRHTF